MTSEIRANTIKNRVGLGTIEYSNTGPVISGVTTALNFKTGTSNLHSTGLNIFDLDVDGHTNLDNVSIAGVTTFANTARFSGGDVIFSGTNNFVQWDKSADYLRFMDGVDATFGNSDDLKIYHNGSHSIIHDTGTGNLSIQSNAGEIQLAKGGSFAHMVRCIVDGAVELYHNGTKKFETAVNGVNLLGTQQNLHGDVKFDNQTNPGMDLRWDESLNRLHFEQDNIKAVFGAGSDLEIYHDSSTNIINGLYHPIELRHQSEVHVKCVDDGAVELYHNNSKKFETSSSGATVTGDLTATNDIIITGSGEFYGYDNSKIVLGHGRDLQIYHDGTDSYILENGSGGLNIKTNGTAISLTKTPHENLARFVVDGACELYFDNSKKLSTTSGGVEITNANGVANLTVKGTGSNRADVRVLATGTENANVYLDASNGDLSGADYAVLQHKNDLNLALVNYAADIEMYVRGGSLGSGGLRKCIHAHENGATELYYNGTKHIYTESGGGAISGKTNLYGHGLGSNANCVSLNFNADNSHTGLHFAGHGQTNASYKAARFVINGTGGTYGSITYTLSGTSYASQSSDRRSKKNIVDWTESELDKFKNLQPKLFHFDHNVDSDPKYKGYIAQDNIAAFPEAYPLVDDRYMFNPSGMVHYLMKAMQELTTKVEILENKVATLEAS